MPSAPVTARSRCLIAASVWRIAVGGFSSSGSSSLLTMPPSRAKGQPPKLWATKRRAPAARAPASRLSVPSVRRRLVVAKLRSKRRRSLRSSIAVSSWTTTSGSACATRRHDRVAIERVGDDRLGACGEQRLRLAGRAGQRRHLVSGATSSGSSGLPIAPVAPATKTFISDQRSNRVGRASEDCDEPNRRPVTPARSDFGLIVDKYFVWVSVEGCSRPTGPWHWRQESCSARSPDNRHERQRGNPDAAPCTLRARAATPWRCG